MKSLLIIIICIGFIFPAKAEITEDSFGELIFVVVVGGTVEATLLFGGVYTSVKNIGYVNDRNKWEPSIIPGYILGASNITAGTILVLKSDDFKNLGALQIAFGILGVGSTVWAHLESKKPQPLDVPTILPDETILTSESWYTYWGLGYANIRYPSDLQDKIDVDKQNESRSPYALDVLGFYWPLTPKTIAGLIVNGTTDGVEVNQNEMRILQYLYAVSVMHYIGNSFGSGFFVRADVGFSNIKQKTENIIKDEDGLGLLVGGGWSFDFGGTRLLLNANYAYRGGIGSESYNTLGISIGGLF